MEVIMARNEDVPIVSGASEQYAAQNQLSPQPVEAPEAAQDLRWPGLIMVALILLGLVWPFAGMVAAVVAYLTADREQATVLFAVAAGALLVRWALGV
jgi:uncharacterized membrane protein